MADNMLRYRGQDNQYRDVATRGDERLGLGFRYAMHPSGVGFLLVRFVARGKEFLPFNVLEQREEANFLEVKEDGSLFLNEEGKPDESKQLSGIRLNKIAIPMFQPAPYPQDVLTHMLELGVLEKVVKWITIQLEADNFEVVGDIGGWLMESLTLPNIGEVKMMLDFPDLAVQKMMIQKMKQAAEELAAESEQEQTGPKTWLN